MLHAIPKPPVKPRCPDCGGDLSRATLYCAPACRAAFHNRMSKRGRVVVPLLLGWRGRRGQGDTAKKAFAELWKFLDRCNAEDRGAGRPSMVEHLDRAFKHRGGLRWNER